ncbi:MAG: TGS domain-containing protein [Paludibacteraceae bacterium]|nr:TGS domain-containing protein [Paludibacteraceae bacterium]
MEDNKVIYDILTERLNLMRQLDKDGDSEHRRHIAKETQDLHAPLAHRLGLYQIKTELEDLALKFIDYDGYKHIAHELNAKKAERDAYIDKFIAPLKLKLEQEGYTFTIKGRPKSIHSIYHKMQVQHCDVDHIYDLFAIRIILDSPLEQEKSDCWQVYSIITDIFQPNPKRLRDWLTMPKENGYESLHTTVLGPENKWVEVQIRTRRMDEVAEQGVAAHWAYKGIHNSNIVSKQESVFVFTPTGDLKKLPAGATVLDFAFAIHSEVGAHCIGGRINGQNAGIRQRLINGDRIEIITSPNQHPTEGWLNDVVSQRAKNKIRQALKEMEFKSASEGREILERKFKNWKIDYTEGDISHIADKLGYKTITELYQAIALGKLEPQQLRDIFEQLTAPTPVTTPTSTTSTPSSGENAPITTAAIEIDMNVKHVDYKLATCCKPKPGEPIFGFISVTKGIRIHHCNCPNAVFMRQRYPYRLIPARWKDTRI